MALDVTPQELAQVRAILTSHVPTIEVWAFGSRVTGRARRFSDLDLCLRTDEEPPDGCLSALRDAFSAADLPWTVDVVMWTDLPDSLRDAITDAHEVIQKRGAAG